MSLRIAIGTDHGGFEKKNEIRDKLLAQGHFVLDCGTATADPTDYPIYAARVAQAVSHGLADFGAIICRSGTGMAMAANRFSGVRAANVHTAETARLARQHNDANTMVVGCDFLDGDAFALLETFLATEHEGGRHARRVSQMAAFDEWADSPLPTHRVLRHGQSIWIDRSQPGSFTRSVAQQRVEGEGLRGILISGEKQDILDAADALMPVWTNSGGDDGFACMPAPRSETNDAVAIRDAVLETDRSFDQSNLMFAIPNTDAGLAAARELVREGTSLCIAGILTAADFDRAADAAIGGYEDALAAGKPVHGLRVAISVEVGAVDVAVNRRLEEMASKKKTREEVLALLRLEDRAALANCQRLHGRLRETFFGERFRKCAAAGAAPARLLWSGTAAISPDMNPLFYADELIAPYTIGLLGNATYEAFLDGATIVRDRLLQKTGEEDELKALEEAGIDFDEVCAGIRESRAAGELHG